MIRARTGQIFPTESFLNCNKEVLAHIWKLNDLSCLEVDVFEACMNWVRKAFNSNQLTREMVLHHLGELL